MILVHGCNPNLQRMHLTSKQLFTLDEKILTLYFDLWHKALKFLYLIAFPIFFISIIYILNCKVLRNTTIFIYKAEVNVIRNVTFGMCWNLNYYRWNAMCLCNADDMLKFPQLHSVFCRHDKSTVLHGMLS